MDFGFLSNPHVPQLGLFEICGNPHFVQRYYGEELLSGLNVPPDDSFLEKPPKPPSRTR